MMFLFPKWDMLIPWRVTHPPTDLLNHWTILCILSWDHSKLGVDSPAGGFFVVLNLLKWWHGFKLYHFPPKKKCFFRVVEIEVIEVWPPKFSLYIAGCFTWLVTECQWFQGHFLGQDACHPILKETEPLRSWSRIMKFIQKTYEMVTFKL